MVLKAGGGAGKTNEFISHFSRAVINVFNFILIIINLIIFIYILHILVQLILLNYQLYI